MVAGGKETIEAMNTDRIVLPVSALKAEATSVFESLAAGRTVYVSRHGDIIAAFRPIDDVPVAVAATYVVPGVATAELTARAIQQAAPSQAVKDAAEGLPSLVTRDHDVYGVLTAASAPSAAAEVPDLDAAASRSEAMRTYLGEHPGAPIEDIVAYRTMLDEQTTAMLPSGRDEDDSVDVPADVGAEVAENLEQWRRRGSAIESPVKEFLAGIRKVLAEALIANRVPHEGIVNVPAVQDFVADWRATVLSDFEKRTGSAVLPPRAVVAVRNAAGLVRTNPVGARAVYVEALAAEPDHEPGVMWRLGDLARTQGYRAEASAWYRLALGWEHQPEIARSITKVHVDG